MDGIEGPPPPHSDYEDDFADASLGWESYSKDEEDTYETSCTGIRDITRHYFHGNGMSFLLSSTAPVAH